MRYIIQVTENDKIFYVASEKVLSDDGNSYKKEYKFVKTLKDAEEYTTKHAIDALRLSSAHIKNRTLKQLYNDKVKRYYD